MRWRYFPGRNRHRRGLPTIDHYRIDPDLGTMDDFRRLVRFAHTKGLPIITNQQLSYSGIEAPHFLKACDDIRAGRTSIETKWFLWSDSPTAPPPAVGDNVFLIRPANRPGYDSQKQEIWKYSERAWRCYWSKWGHEARSPSYNWNSPEWREEAERIIRFWMDTGLDGMVVDANPQAIDGALRNYDGPVVSAGGVVYFGPDFTKHQFTEPGKQRLLVMSAALAGDLVAYRASQEPTIDPEITRLFQTRAAHPALHQLSTRRQLPTNAGDKYYSFLRTSADKSERVIVVLNFQSSPQTVRVDLSGVACEALVDLANGDRVTRRNAFSVELPAYGYRIFLVK
jgi:glycosidase